METQIPNNAEANLGFPLNDITPEILLSPSEIYHENSKLHPSDQGIYAWINYVNTSPDIRQIISRPFNHYRGYPSIKLTREFPPTSSSFEEVIVKRRSQREFSGQNISLQALSKILYLGDGIVDTWQTADNSTWSVRTAPSGGGLYPIDLYCIAFRVDDLLPGLYFYSPIDHCVERLFEKDLTQSLIMAAPASEQAIRQASACLMMVGIMPRINFKYGERAYRFVLLEAGHIAQNLLLAAQAEGLGAFPVGGFIDDQLNELLSLNGVTEVVLYFVIIGC